MQIITLASERRNAVSHDDVDTAAASLPSKCGRNVSL